VLHGRKLSAVTGSLRVMEFQDVVRRRRMVRTFLDKPVPQASLDRILRNAVRGPSAGFCQGQAFLVLTGEQLPAFWATASEAAEPSVQTAPLVIVPLSCKRIYIDAYVENADEGEDWTDEAAWWPVPFWHIDTGMAALLILQTTVDEGLAACYFGIMPQAFGPLREAFGIPDDHDPIGAIAIGHSAETAHPNLSAHRRPREQMIHHGRW
jgi:nitroreductase